MSKRNLDAVARIINRQPYLTQYADTALFLVTKDLASYFELEDVKFDRQRFLAAAGFAGREAE